MAEGEEQDESQKTEEPTAKRREEAHKKGQVAFSREVTSFLILCVLAITISGFAPSMLHNARLLLEPFITRPDSFILDPNGVSDVLMNSILGGLKILILPMAGTIFVVLMSSLLQNGVIFTAEPIMPKLSKISPLGGLKRMFSARSLAEFLKGIVKIIIVGVVGFVAVYPELSHIRQLPNSTAEAMMSYLQSTCLKLLIGILIAMFFIAILDFFFQRWQLTKQLRMTKQEIKDEYKQTEGDPMVKQRLKALRQERARQRMMAAVPEADVVITNPTHFAVALKYDSQVMKAPIVVAKGQDLIAQRIRDVAKENDVPIVENKPLAQALYKSVKIDEEIPIVHYEAVAKIISYVYELKGRKF